MTTEDQLIALGFAADMGLFYRIDLSALGSASISAQRRRLDRDIAQVEVALCLNGCVVQRSLLGDDPAATIADLRARFWGFVNGPGLRDMLVTTQKHLAAEQETIARTKKMIEDIEPYWPQIKQLTKRGRK